jgi:hypothetical protein
MLFKFMSCSLSFIFDYPIIRKTEKHIDQSDNISLFALGFVTLTFSKTLYNKCKINKCFQKVLNRHCI